MNTILYAYPEHWEFWLMLLLIPVALYFAYLFYIKIPRDMAHRRHREATPWVLLGFAISPIWVIIILLIVGDKRPDPYEDVPTWDEYNAQEEEKENDSMTKI